MSLRNRLLAALRALPVTLLIFAGSAQAQDLSSAVDDAAKNFKSLISKGLSVAAIVIAAVSLGMAGFRFSQKDPNAIWYVAGTLACGVLFGVAKGLMS